MIQINFSKKYFEKNVYTTKYNIKNHVLKDTHLHSSFLITCVILQSMIIEKNTLIEYEGQNPDCLSIVKR